MKLPAFFFVRSIFWQNKKPLTNGRWSRAFAKMKISDFIFAAIKLYHIFPVNATIYREFTTKMSVFLIMLPALYGENQPIEPYFSVSLLSGNKKPLTVCALSAVS